MNRTGPHPLLRRRSTATVTAFVAAGAAVVSLLWPGTAPHPQAAAIRYAPTVVTTAPAAPAPPRAPRSIPARHVQPVAVAHDDVPASVPHAFSISGPAFTVSAHVCSMAAHLPLEPPGEQHHTVCWVDERFGVAPGSATATSFILGHSWSRDRLEVLNALSSRATAQLLHATPRVVDGVRTYPLTVFDGYVVTLRTARGVLRYRVRDAYGVNKYEAHNLRAMWDSTIARRVVLITCAERNGIDYPYNVVLDAYLVSSERLA